MAALELVFQVVELHKAGWFVDFPRDALQRLHDKLTDLQTSEKNATAKSLLRQTVSLLGQQLMQA